jgi:hypothetical protein
LTVVIVDLSLDLATDSGEIDRNFVAATEMSETNPTSASEASRRRSQLSARANIILASRLADQAKD